VQKLQLVQQALINAANPTTICQHYGFKSYSTFYRNYQKFYGCRPSDDSRPTPRKIEL
jgi:AraC-like DNA-binding protein